MKKFYLLLTSFFYTVNLFAGGWYIPFMHDSPKSYIIPGLISSVYYEDPNPRYITNPNIYNIYDADLEQLEARFEELAIDKRLVEEVLNKLNYIDRLSYDYPKRELFVYYSEYKPKAINGIGVGRKIYQKFSLDNPISFNFPLYNKFLQSKALPYFEYLIYKSIIHNKRATSYPEINRLKDRLVVKYEESTDQFLKDKYATLLIRHDLFLSPSKDIFLENFDYSNCKEYVALSDFAGYFYHAKEKEEKHIEKSVYYFSLLSKNPKLIFNAFREVNFVLSSTWDYKFSWSDCLNLCTNEQEKENLLFIMSNRFNGVNISILETFAELTNINSPHFESLLINYVKRLVHVGIKEDSCDKKDDCSKCVEANEFYDFINDLKLSNKPLLYFLRGYTAFLIEDTKAYQLNFNKCRSSISSSELNKLEKKNFLLQLEGVELMDDLSRCSSIKKFQKLKIKLIDHINNTPFNLRHDSYFDAVVKKAIKVKDFVSAFEFSEKRGYTQSILLDVYMSDEDIKKIQKIVENGNLNFSYRFDKNLHEYLVELLGVKEFRRNNIDKAISYFKQTKKVEKSEEYALKIKKQFEKIQTIKASNISEIEMGDSLANCYLNIAKLYSNYEWMYFSFWRYSLVYGIHHMDNVPFHSLESNFIKEQFLLYLNEYGGLQNTIKFYKKAIAVASDIELQARASHMLLEIYNEPYLTSIHDDVFDGTFKWYNSLILDSAYLANAPDSLKFVYTEEQREMNNKIDSLYKNTNYFKEVISECEYLYPNKKVNVETLIIDDEEAKAKKSKNEIYFLAFVILLILGFIINRLTRK